MKTECPLCRTDRSFHLHCAVCRGPVEGFTRRTCSDDCRATLKRERRKRQSIQCWVSPMDGLGKKFRRWLPIRLVLTRHNGVFSASGPRRRDARDGKGVDA